MQEYQEKRSGLGLLGYMERMDLNIRNPHFAINDADNWYRGNDPRAIITYRGAFMVILR